MFVFVTLAPAVGSGGLMSVGRFTSTASSVAAVLGLFTALTVVMTWPQARQISTHAVDHHDVFFNMWRLGWFAHALASAPSTIFDGNIFYPEPNALTFSDAIIIEGLVAAPLLWAGMPPVLVHNLLLLGAVIASALGMYVLVDRLTRDRAAGVVAGIIFAFAPYRFEHYMHMEMQWAVWMPWAFWAVHRTLESGRLLHGLQAGAFVALQVLSSIYYGIFLATVLPLVGVLLLLGLERPQALRALRALALGGGAAAIICSLYALPYLATRKQVGERPVDEIARFSARPYDYLTGTPNNRLYSDVFPGRGERRLFPGMLPLLLGITGVFLRAPTRPVIAYLIALVAAFEMSLGLHSYIYRFLYDHVPVFSGLRATARWGIFVIMFLAVLAAFGYAALRQSVSFAARRVLLVIVPCVLLIEYYVAPLELVAYANSPPPLYEFLAQLPPGVVAEFPTPGDRDLPAPEAQYAYMSTFHWKPLVNGYSGYYPTSYLRRLQALRSFPDDSSLNVLRGAGVNYVVVHISYYGLIKGRNLLVDLQNKPELRVLGRLTDGDGAAVVYALE